eukprot:422284-Hanusia_phi.AAC.1
MEYPSLPTNLMVNGGVLQQGGSTYSKTSCCPGVACFRLGSVDKVSRCCLRAAPRHPASGCNGDKAAPEYVG